MPGHFFLTLAGFFKNFAIYWVVGGLSFRLINEPSDHVVCCGIVLIGGKEIQAPG